MNLGRIIKYQPELNAFTGSITATLLLSQLEYWFGKVEGKPFYKFLAPCEDECYQKGDSWSEELGFSKAEFRNAFKRIGKVYKSKKEYTQSKDPFEGKLYLSYYDRIRRRTYYLRNHELANKLLETIIPTSSTNQKTERPITEDYTKDLHTKITTEDDFTHSLSSSSNIHDEVITLYHELCPDLAKVEKLTPSRRRMIDTLLGSLGGSLSKIHTLFEKTHASDFLNGRLPNNKWQALFDWIISTSNSLAILDGKYDTWKTAPHKQSVSHTQTKFTTMHSHNWDYDKLDQLAYDYFLSLS